MKISWGLKIAVLTVLVVLVWTFNVRLLKKLPAKINAGAIQTKPILFPTDSLIRDDFVYKDLSRDPFNAVLRDTINKEPVMPAFTLAGVVLARTGSLALMQLADGNVYTMKKGEKCLGVTVKEITSRQVTIEFRGRQEILQILQ